MGKIDMVRLLVEHGADINAATAEDSSYVGKPLLAATEMLNKAPDTIAQRPQPLGATGRGCGAGRSPAPSSNAEDSSFLGGTKTWLNSGLRFSP